MPAGSLHQETPDSHRDWRTGKTWKNGKVFSIQGKVREFCQDWKSQGIVLKILENLENFLKYWKKIREICQTEIVKTLQICTIL